MRPIQFFLPVLVAAYCSSLFAAIDHNPEDCQESFEQVYKTRLWGGSRIYPGYGSSGMGANPRVVEVLIRGLEDFIKQYNIKTFLDIGCGECEWQPAIDWEGLGVEYLGVDVVAELIEMNRERLSYRPAMSFETKNMLVDPLPSADLYFIKDVLAHLPNAFIDQFFLKAREGTTKVLVYGNFTEKAHLDLKKIGGGRPLHEKHLRKEPFYQIEQIKSFAETHPKLLYFIDYEREKELKF